MPKEFYMNGRRDAQYNCSYSSNNSPLVCVPQNIPNASTLVCNVGPNYPVPFSVSGNCTALDFSYNPSMPQTIGGSGQVNIHLPQGAQYHGVAPSPFTPAIPTTHNGGSFNTGPDARLLQNLETHRVSMSSSSSSNNTSGTHENKNEGVRITNHKGGIVLKNMFKFMRTTIERFEDEHLGKEENIRKYVIIGNKHLENRGSRDPNDGISLVAKEVVGDIGILKGILAKRIINISNADLNDNDISYIRINLNKHILNLYLFDASHNKITSGGAFTLMLNFLNYPEYKHTKIIDLSHNSITDLGSEQIASEIAAGKLPHLKKLDISDNPTTSHSYKMYEEFLKFGNVQDMIVIFKKLNNHQTIIPTGRATEKIAAIKNMIAQAKAAGIDTDNVVVNKSFYSLFKNNLQVKMDFSYGLAKCLIIPDSATDYAQDKIKDKVKDHFFAKLPKVVGKFAGAVASIVDIQSKVNCYLQATDESLKTEAGVHQMEIELELLGIQEVYESLE